MLDKYYSVPVYAFAALSFVSIAAGNIALAHGLYNLMKATWGI